MQSDRKIIGWEIPPTGRHPDGGTTIVFNDAEGNEGRMQRLVARGAIRLPFTNVVLVPGGLRREA